MRQCQLMWQTTTIGIFWQQGREEGDEDVEWVWLSGGCVSPPTQEMRLAVAWTTVALLNVCVVWPRGCCVLFVGWVAGFRWPGDT